MKPLFRPRGFTLIELLLSAAAGALILSVMVNVYASALRQRNAANNHLRESRLQARAVQIIQNDLRHARLSGGLMAKTLDTASTNTRSRFPGNLRFTTASAGLGEDQLQGDLREVEYYIAADETANDGKSGKLVRTVNHALLNNVTEEYPEETILRGVESLEISFYDGSNWTDTWTVDPTNLLVPAGIRLRIGLSAEAHPDTSRRTIEVLVPWNTAVAIPPVATTTDPSADAASGDGGGTGTGAGTGTGSGTGTGTGGTGTGGGTP